MFLTAGFTFYLLQNIILVKHYYWNSKIKSVYLKEPLSCAAGQIARAGCEGRVEFAAALWYLHTLIKRLAQVGWQWEAEAETEAGGALSYNASIDYKSRTAKRKKTPYLEKSLAWLVINSVLLANPLP